MKNRGKENGGKADQMQESTEKLNAYSLPLPFAHMD